jgi:hypothetical protein
MSVLTLGRTPWMGDNRAARSQPTQNNIYNIYNIYTDNKAGTCISMVQVEYEPSVLSVAGNIHLRQSSHFN